MMCFRSPLSAINTLGVLTGVESFSLEASEEIANMGALREGSLLLQVHAAVFDMPEAHRHGAG
jgi:hypothetical protein